MFKWTKLSTLLVLILVGLFTIAAYKPSLFQGGIRITPLRGGTQPQLFIIEDGSGNTLFKIGNQGQINNQNVVLINSFSNLSAWSDTGGASYFQTEAGKTYIVDPHAIWTDTSAGGAPGGTTTFAATFASGVSALLPLATSINHKETVTIAWATIGDLAGGSGSTTVQVWPAPDTGTTSYRANGAVKTSQNASIMATSGSSTVTVGVTGSMNLDAYGDTGTWMLLYNSAVSAHMVNRYMP